MSARWPRRCRIVWRVSFERGNAAGEADARAGHGETAAVQAKFVRQRVRCQAADERYTHKLKSAIEMAITILLDQTDLCSIIWCQPSGASK